MPSLRLSKAIEGVAEMLLPPLLEVCPVFLSELMELLLFGVQLCRIVLPRQGDRVHHPAALFPDTSSQIGQRPALAYEIIDHDVLAALDAAFKGGLPGEPSVAVSSGVRHDFGRNYGEVGYGSAISAFSS